MKNKRKNEEKLKFQRKKEVWNSKKLKTWHKWSIPLSPCGSELLRISTYFFNKFFEISSIWWFNYRNHCKCSFAQTNTEFSSFLTEEKCSISQKWVANSGVVPTVADISQFQFIDFEYSKEYFLFSKSLDLDVCFKSINFYEIDSNDDW